MLKNKGSSGLGSLGGLVGLVGTAGRVWGRQGRSRWALLPCTSQRRDTHVLPARAPTLTERQVVPRPVITAQRNHVVQIRVADLESLVTGDDQLVSVSVCPVMNLSIVDLRDTAICKGIKRTRYFFKFQPFVLPSLAQSSSFRTWPQASL